MSSYKRSARKPSNKQTSVVLEIRLAAPVGQRPNAHRSEGIAVLGPLALSRRVSVERAVLASAVPHEVNAGLPSSARVNAPAGGMVRSDASMRAAAMLQRH